MDVCMSELFFASENEALLRCGVARNVKKYFPRVDLDSVYTRKAFIWYHKPQTSSGYSVFVKTLQ